MCIATKATAPEAELNLSEACSSRYSVPLRRVWLPDLQRRGRLCLRFHYNMHGFHVSVLEAVLWREGAPRPDVLFQREGQQGAEWVGAEVDVTLQQPGDRVSALTCRH